jgi:hypothetical protein
VTISYPLAFPTTRAPAHIDFAAEDVIGLSESPFTFEAQKFDWQAGRWAGMLAWGEMNRADADTVISFLNSLRGVLGTFLFWDPFASTQQGTWSGAAPLVNGAGQSGYTLAIDGLGAGATIKARDPFQLGSGASSRLYNVQQDATANGSGQVTLDLWPRLRSAPADNAPLTLASPKGLWRLATNKRRWSLADVRYSGIDVPIAEDL